MKDLSLRNELRRFRATPIGAVLNVVPRFLLAMSYYTPALARIFSWTFRSREFTNFTYDISEEGLRYAAHALSIVTGLSVKQLSAYMTELQSDVELKEHVVAHSYKGAARWISDPRCDFGRQLVWYAVTRAHKPRIVVETGVDKGLGSVVLCAALRRNATEGFHGKYYGTDINNDAGWLLQPPYSDFGTILYGDSLEMLSKFTEEIDLFVNDSDHSAVYEEKEYVTVAGKLSPTAIILGDNAHVTDRLAQFSERAKRHFVFVAEKPKNHWYPGAGVGISFNKPL